MTQLFDTEETPEGTQALVPGVEPIATRDRIHRAKDRPLSGSNAPCDVGLFDDSAKQLDMLDLI